MKKFLLLPGQTLLEAVIAIALVGSIITGITIAISSSLYSADFSKNQHLATGYAKEGIEIVRYLRNTDYNAFATKSGIYCLPIGSATLDTQGKCPPTADLQAFVREIEITQNGCDTSVAATKVTSSVSWSSSKCSDANNRHCHVSDITTCLTDYTVQPPL
ncbi:MAG: hypothetical protein HY431_01985 [Candidatus Levybacteria bacterium]|nr:hypothetical protein [Candidatus Levybacteria bacterium]